MSVEEMILKLYKSLDEMGRGIEVVWDMEIVQNHFEPARQEIRDVIAELEKLK